MSPEATLEKIWIKRAKSGPMDPVRRAVALAGCGLEGNANQGGKRQVTLLATDAWQEAADELGLPVDPALRRANLLVSGIDLAESRGRVLEVGPVTIRIWGETRPCRQMEESQAGLQEALSSHWRGGAYGEIETGGEISVGDRVRWLPESSNHSRPLPAGGS